jgi:Peptidase family M23
MRPARGFLLPVITLLCCACAASPAMAIAGVPGGAQAPASPVAGGSEYGVAVAEAGRPLVTHLSVPRSAVAGRPPRISLRIDEKGVGTVYLQVTIVNLKTHRAAVIALMGWSHTGRTLVVPWPSNARLNPGTFQVTVSAHDHRRSPLLRTAHSSGEATLTVSEAPKPAPAPTPVPAETTPSTTEAGVPTPAETVADGAVFPVDGTHNFGGPENRFGAPRSGHIHQGQDILTAEGTPDLAPLSGLITSTDYQAGGAGYYVVEHTSIGFDFMFAHCEAGSFTVSKGQGVSAGQMLCKAGQTGDATAPHLHFEMWVGGWQASTGHPIDPLPYLEAWER